MKLEYDIVVAPKRSFPLVWMGWREAIMTSAFVFTCGMLIGVILGTALR